MMLFLSLSSLVMNIEYVIIQIPLNGYNPPDIDHANLQLTEGTIASDWLGRLNVRMMHFAALRTLMKHFNFQYLINDGIVVWRAWILFQQEQTWRVALMLLMIMNVGV